jgi:acyl carrier protein
VKGGGRKEREDTTMTVSNPFAIMVFDALSEVLDGTRSALSFRGEELLFTEVGIDSLQYLDLLMSLEKRTGRRFEEEDVLDVRTVGELVERVGLVARR